MSVRNVHTFPGGSGSGGGPYPPAPQKTYTQTVSTPATTWTITHPLGTRTPMVALWTLDGHTIDDADVFTPDNATVVISFAVPFAGTVVLQA